MTYSPIGVPMPSDTEARRRYEETQRVKLPPGPVVLVPARAVAAGDPDWPAVARLASALDVAGYRVECTYAAAMRPPTARHPDGQRVDSIAVRVARRGYAIWINGKAGGAMLHGRPMNVTEFRRRLLASDQD